MNAAFAVSKSRLVHNDSIETVNGAATPRSTGHKSGNETNQSQYDANARKAANMFVNSNDFVDSRPVDLRHYLDNHSSSSADRRREYVMSTPPPRTSPRFEPIDQLIDRLVVPILS